MADFLKLDPAAGLYKPVKGRALERASDGC